MMMQLSRASGAYIYSVHSDPRPPYERDQFFIGQRTHCRVPHTNTRVHAFATYAPHACNSHARARVHIIKCNLSPCIVFNYIELHAYFKIVLRQRVGVLTSICMCINICGSRLCVCYIMHVKDLLTAAKPANCDRTSGYALFSPRGKRRIHVQYYILHVL